MAVQIWQDSLNVFRRDGMAVNHLVLIKAVLPIDHHKPVKFHRKLLAHQINLKGGPSCGDKNMDSFFL